MLQINIATGNDVPLFRQIVEQVKLAVASGKLEVGEALPSVRALATDLRINPNTISRAYGDLVRDGVIDSQRGKGYFVAPRREIFTKKERHRRVMALVQPLVAEAKSIGIDDEELLQIISTQLQKYSTDSPSNPKSGGE